MGYVLLGVFGGALFLHVFYRALAASWPASYFAADSYLQYRITRHPWRYLLFRFLPVFVTCVFVGVSLDRGDQNAVAGVLGIGALHVLLSSGRGVLAQLRAGSTRRDGPLLLLHSVVSIGVLSVAALSIPALDEVADLVPGVREVSAALWTAVLAAVLGAYLVRVASTPSPEPSRVFSESQQSIGKDLWQYAERAATRMGVDAHLLHAIMLVENVQRPRWFRALERAKGRLFKAGTYGVTQVASAVPLSDAESIDRCIDHWLRGVNVAGAEEYVDSERLRAFAQIYNPQPAFADQLQDAYLYLETRRDPDV